MKNYSVVIIGLGGIGSILCEKIFRFLNYLDEVKVNVTLVDGDDFELKNHERQEFSMLGNKAEVKANDLKYKFDQISVDAIPRFVNPYTIEEIVKEKDIVLLAVDNHKTRNIVSNYCKELRDVTLISGGNELTDGNVQIYIRRGGRDLTPDLGAYHPEIQSPRDRTPEEMSCEELSKSEPQLYFTNLGAATLMCWVFYNVVVKENYKFSEVYFDILTMLSDSKVRILTK